MPPEWGELLEIWGYLYSYFTDISQKLHAYQGLFKICLDNNQSESEEMAFQHVYLSHTELTHEKCPEE